jgi:hypothetical protein
VNQSPDSLAPQPNNNESKIDYINRIGVHEGTHVTNDKNFYNINYNTGTVNQQTSPDYENLPYVKEGITITRQNKNK